MFDPNPLATDASIPVRIGIVDSGLSAAQQHNPAVIHSAALRIQHNQLWLDEPTPDASGHGTDIADIMLTLAPDCELVSAQVFQEDLNCTAIQVASAIDWLVEEGCDIINLSLGLRQPREVLAQACQRAAAVGVILVAASPAQGNAVYPAAYPDVIRATGDARCQHDQITYLASHQADVGGCARPLSNRIGRSGASMGCAHITALLGQNLRQFMGQEYQLSESEQALHWLYHHASFHGREYYSAPGSRNSEVSV